MKILPPYKPRFVTEEGLTELFNLYHLARVPLSGTGRDTPYERMLWASREYAKQHPEVSATGAYKDLCSAREYGGW